MRLPNQSVSVMRYKHYSSVGITGSAFTLILAASSFHNRA
jgi:hypothetical protein